jgi:hypothetical protein
MLGGQTMVVEYPIYKTFPFKLLFKHVSLQDASTIGMHLRKYTPRSATG